MTGPEVHFNHCDINLYVFCAQVEEHLKAVHDQGGKKASKKRKQAFEWRCRLVNKEFLMKSLKSLVASTGVSIISKNLVFYKC